MPRIAPDNKIANLSSVRNVVYCVVADPARASPEQVKTFYEYVYRASGTDGRVKDILWKNVKLLNIEQLEVPILGLMDGVVQEAITNLWQEWENHELHDKAVCKLILAPLHGTNKKASALRGKLLWSHDGQGNKYFRSSPGLPQALESALADAHEVGFRHVILQYCYSGLTLTELPRSLENAFHIQPATYSEVAGDMSVVGFNDVEWSSTVAAGSTSVYRYLSLGAPISKTVSCDVPKQYVVSAKVTLFEPISSLTRKSSRQLSCIFVATSVFFVGGGVLSQGPTKYYTPEAMKLRDDARGIRKAHSDEQCLQGPPHSQDTMLQTVLRRRLNGLVRVRYTDNRDGSTHVQRGRIQQKFDDHVVIRYVTNDGEQYDEEIPLVSERYVITHVERLDSV